MEQRWLTLSGICDVLGADKRKVQAYVKAGVLQRFGIRNRYRYLDPTPEFVEKFKLAEALYDTERPLPKDFDLTALLTIAELAAILGWKESYARQYVRRRKVKALKVGKYHLYSVAVVRDILWARSGRKLAKQKAPFLLTDLIRFFLAHQERQTADVPSDADFLADDDLMKRFSRLLKLKSPEKEAAVRELWAKVETAKAVAAALQTPTPQP